MADDAFKILSFINQLDLMLTAQTCREHFTSLYLKPYHDPRGGAEVQLDDEAVPPGQEGGPGGRHQHAGVHGGGEIWLPSFG